MIGNGLGLAVRPHSNQWNVKVLTSHVSDGYISQWKQCCETRWEYSYVYTNLNTFRWCCCSLDGKNPNFERKLFFHYMSIAGSFLAYIRTSIIFVNRKPKFKGSLHVWFRKNSHRHCYDVAHKIENFSHELIQRHHHNVQYTLFWLPFSMMSHSIHKISVPLANA